MSTATTKVLELDLGDTSETVNVRFARPYFDGVNMYRKGETYTLPAAAAIPSSATVVTPRPPAVKPADKK